MLNYKLFIIILATQVMLHKLATYAYDKVSTGITIVL